MLLKREKAITLITDFFENLFEENDNIIENVNDKIDWNTVTLDTLSYGTVMNWLEEMNFFEVEFVYYYDAMEYLAKEDNSLMFAVGYAVEQGYSLENMNSVVLATIHATTTFKNEFEEAEYKIDDLFDEVREILWAEEQN